MLPRPELSLLFVVLVFPEVSRLLEAGLELVDFLLPRSRLADFALPFPCPLALFEPEARLRVSCGIETIAFRG